MADEPNYVRIRARSGIGTAATPAKVEITDAEGRRIDGVMSVHIVMSVSDVVRAVLVLDPAEVDVDAESQAQMAEARMQAILTVEEARAQYAFAGTGLTVTVQHSQG